MRKTIAVMIGAGLTLVGSLGAAGSPLEVSVTFTGDIDGIIALLVQLRNMTGGEGIAETEDPLKLRVHSMVVGPVEEGEGVSVEPAPEETPPPEPVLGLFDLSIEPATVRAGASAVVRVRVSDPQRVVDTVAAEIGAPGRLAKDLLDNGAQGDEAAGDNVWTRIVEIPPNTPAGEYAVTVNVYDVYGDLVQHKTAEGAEAPLAIVGAITVTK